MGSFEEVGQKKAPRERLPEGSVQRLSGLVELEPQTQGPGEISAAGKFSADS